MHGGQGYAGQMRSLSTLVAACAGALIAAAPAAAERFVVTYEGTGAWHTTFHAHPPNPDGHKDDRNDARDTSRQRWALRFRDELEIPACDGPGDPCASVTGAYGARGPASMTGRVRHKHVDGIYRQLDRTVKCRLAKRTAKGRDHDVTLSARYLPESHGFALSVSDPMATTLTMFPTACPDQGDSIDRILDFYAIPGFSFADGFGPERWFASREVVVSEADLRTGRKVRIRLGATKAGTPPRRCAVANPSYERCRTGGHWRGTITLTPKADSGKSSATIEHPKVVTPSGHYASRRVDMFVDNRSIEVVGFTFDCRATTGRVSLNGLRLKKTRRGWRLPATLIYGSVTYADDHPDQNARLNVSGRFSRTGRSIRGSLRVKSPHCGDTGAHSWSARLKSR